MTRIFSLLSLIVLLGCFGMIKTVYCENSKLNKGLYSHLIQGEIQSKTIFVPDSEIKNEKQKDSDDLQQTQESFNDEEDQQQNSLQLRQSQNDGDDDQQQDQNNKKKNNQKGVDMILNRKSEKSEKERGTKENQQRKEQILEKETIKIQIRQTMVQVEDKKSQYVESQTQSTRIRDEIKSDNFPLVHGIVLTICWGLLIDVAIMIIRFLRTIKNYKLAHALFFFLINLVSIPFIVIMIVKKINIFQNFLSMNALRKTHMIIGLLILVLIIFEHVLGILTKSVQENISTRPIKFQKVRAIHKAIGYILYVLTKIQILIGWWNYGAWISVIICILFIWFVSLFIIRMLLEDQFYKGKLFWLITFFQRFQKLNLVRNENQALLDQNYHVRSMKLNSQNHCVVFFKDMMIELRDFKHPGGDSIIKIIEGKDITKYIFGSAPLEGTKVKLHQHSAYAIQYMKCNCIQTHQKSFYTLFDEEKWSIDIVQQMTSNLFKFIFYNPAFSLKINQSNYIQQIGNYVLVQTPSGTRTYSIVLSQLEHNIKYRDKLLLFFAKGFQDMSLQIPQQQVINKLPLIIKKYKNGNVSTDIHYTNKFQRLSKIYGKPLKIQSGVNIIITGGTGILPFLDLFDLILKKAIFTIHQRSNIQNKSQIPNLYGINYRNVYPWSKFIVYASFKKLSQFKCFEWLNRLHQISNKFKLDLFELHLKDIKYKQIPIFKGKINKEFIRQQFPKGSFSKMFVSGTPYMNNQILEVLKQMNYESKTYEIM